MPRLGRIEQWDDGKGYGFVRPLESQAADGDAARAFVHIKAIAHAGRRPTDGDLIRYDGERDARGRLNAVNASFVNAGVMRAQAQRRKEAKAAVPRQRHASGALRDRLHHAVLACAVVALAAGPVLGRWPAAVSLAYAAMSLVAFLAYRHDKNAAGSERRRTPESTLHALDLFCGWPGGLLAQQVYRHKTRKGSFQVVFWITMVVNCAAFLWLARTFGAML